MTLSSKLFTQAGEDLQGALEAIDGLQSRVVIVDNDKLPYDQAINKLDKNLLDQCDVVNEAFNDVETAYNNRIVGVCKTDMFWRVTDINDTVTPTEYSLICTKLNGGGYTQKSDFKFPSSEDDDNYFGNTLILLRPDGNIEIFPINSQNARGLGVGYTFGFDPRNYYGIKYYNEPYSDDIGDTLVGGFIGTITQGESTLTVMQPVGAGLSELLKVGQIIEPKDLNVFSGTTKITGITTGFTDLSEVTTLVGIATTVSRVNVLTVDSIALRSVRAPLDNGNYGSFDVLDDPANFANSGREKYSLSKDADPFLPQTVGIMQTANIGMGVSIGLDNSGYPNAAMSWNPDLEGYSIEPSGTPIIEPPKNGSGVCYWRVGFSAYPKASVGSAAKAAENDTLTVEVDDIDSLYGTLSACPSALDTAITDAIGVSSTKETTLRGANDADNPTLVEGVNSLRTERNEHYSLPIWGFRVGIGAQNEIVDRLNTLQQHLDNLTIRNVVDS
tara:strand:+ start:696 stop:2195 length:1500 start_codon:yes stop_codon:yes gene_type:complete